MTENINPIHTKTSEMTIGKVKYIVTSVFSETARETAEQKFLRLVSDRVSDELKVSEKVLF